MFSADSFYFFSAHSNVIAKIVKFTIDAFSTYSKALLFNLKTQHLINRVSNLTLKQKSCISYKIYIAQRASYKASNSPAHLLLVLNRLVSI